VPKTTMETTWDLICHLRASHGCEITPRMMGTLKLADYQAMHREQGVCSYATES
jgi:hypothetical protein